MAGAWYIGRASWRRRWRGLVFLGLFAGLVGGAILAASAGARRTASAYDRLLEASGAPHELLFVTGQDAKIEEWLRRTPSVDHTARAAGLIGRQSPQQNWYSLYAFDDASPLRTAVFERGRLPRADRAEEVAISVRTARNTGLDVGDEVVFDSYAREQAPKLIKNPWEKPAGRRVALRVVGIARDPSDAQLSQTTKVIFGTPAFAQQYGDEAAARLVAIWLKDGPAGSDHYRRELAEFSRTFSKNEMPPSAISSRDDADSADDASHAVVVGLLIFAVVAAVAGVVAIAQSVRRYLARDDDERRVLVALGAGRAARAGAQFIGALPYLAIVPVVAVATAYAASPLFPVGAARTLEPHSGLRVDALVFVAGAAAWFVALAALTMLVAWWGSAREAGTVRRNASTRLTSAEVGTASLPLAIGVGFALLPRAARRGLQRASIAGLVVAVTGVVGSTLFVSSLDSFTHAPERFGLDFDLSVEMPLDKPQAVLRQAAEVNGVGAVAAARAGVVELEGRGIDAYAIEPVKGEIVPVPRSGRLPANDAEIAIGPKLLDALGKHVGDHVQLGSGAGSRSLKIVGTALSPAPETSAFNAEAVLTPGALDAFATNPFVEGLVRADRGADRDALFRALHERFPYGVNDESLPHAPGPVRNLEQITRLPLALALFFAFLGAAAITHALFMTATERRRDIAVLRSLGFTRRQAGMVMLAAGTSLAVVALVLGVPFGIIAGRLGWSAVARSLYVAPDPVIPVLAVTAAAFGLLVFANLVALVPARSAVRHTVGTDLRSE